MHTSPMFDPLVKAVRVADLRAYLLSKGWRIKPFPRPQILYFEGPPDGEGRPIVQLVPASEQLKDYGQRVHELVSALSAIEQRPVSEILRNIVTPTCDILHLGLESAETRTGTLELGFVGQFFANLRNLLVFAACAELRPQRFFRRALKPAVRFADRCRLRPAPVGSFRVDVEAPLVPPAHEAQVKLGTYPFERVITLALMQGLGLLQQAIESGKTDAIFQEPARHLNANLCEALVGMKPDGAGIRLEARVSWSSTWPLDGQAVPEAVVFEGKAFEQIEAIARALRAGNESQRRQLRGRIVRLSAENPAQEDAGPLVVVLHVESPNAPAHVEIFLTPEQYREACRAHLEGRRIAVRGLLDRIGRKWQLLNVADFHVLPAEALS